MPSHHQAISLVVLAVLVGGLWISTFSMRRRLRTALKGMDPNGWTIRSRWYLTSVRGEGVVSGRKVIIELVGTVQLVLRIAVECRTEYSARMLVPVWITKFFSLKHAVRLPDGIIIVSKEESDRNFARKLGETEEGSILLRSLLRESSADLLWFGDNILVVFFRRPPRKLLAPHGLEPVLSRLLEVASLIELAAGQSESATTPP